MRPALLALRRPTLGGFSQFELCSPLCACVRPTCVCVWPLNSHHFCCRRRRRLQCAIVSAAELNASANTLRRPKSRAAALHQATKHPRSGPNEGSQPASQPAGRRPAVPAELRVRKRRQQLRWIYNYEIVGSLLGCLGATNELCLRRIGSSSCAGGNSIRQRQRSFPFQAKPSARCCRRRLHSQFKCKLLQLVRIAPAPTGVAHANAKSVLSYA